MAINLKHTGDLSLNGVKLLVYGQAGAGKTRLIPTLPSPVALSAEGGLLSIREHNIPYIEINNLDDLYEVYRWLESSEEAKQFETLAIDSISEVAEVVLASELKSNRDGRAAYGEMANKMAEIIRAFRDIPGKHVYMSAKMGRTQDELGRILHGPMMPGNTLTQQIPYFFDEVLAMRVEKDAEGNEQRALMCHSDGVWQAKDRSGKLAMWEAPDLGAVINKIMGVE